MPLELTKKPVNVQGVKYTGDNLDEVKEFCPDCYTKDGDLFIKTMEGDHKVVDNAVVIKGVRGEFYPVDPSVFEQTYEIREGDTKVSTEKRWNKEQREEAPDYKWALPEKNKLRIDDKKHVRLAWAMVDRTNGLTDEDRAKARKRILAKAKKFGIDTSAWGKGNESLTNDTVNKSAGFYNHLLTEMLVRNNILSMYIGLAIKCGLFDTSETEDQYYFALINDKLNSLKAVVSVMNEEVATSTPETSEVLEPVDQEEAVEAYLKKLTAEFKQGQFDYPTE